jgi:UPF0755 protein
MSRYRSSKSRVPRKIIFLFFLAVIVVVVGAFATNEIYKHDLEPVSSNTLSQIFTVSPGATTKDIAKQLQGAKLIRSAWAFELYVHAHPKSSELQAGTYALSPSESLSQIVAYLNQGKVTTKLVTIIPGRRIDQVKADLINDGFSPTDVTNALNPANYASLPVMAFKPANVNTLEGLLWPDSFQKDPNTSPSVIITESLNETSKHLTPAVQASFANEGLTTYQGLVLSSVILQEVNKPDDQTQVAQVFLSRLKAGMDLGSDVTANYGAIEAGLKPSLTYDSPYNTLIHAGLPPTPISTINSNSLYAATHPASTTWLYFVTGDNGTTYFSSDLATHQAQTAQYCHKLCQN